MLFDRETKLNPLALAQRASAMLRSAARRFRMSARRGAEYEQISGDYMKCKGGPLSFGFTGTGGSSTGIPVYRCIPVHR